jgi:hypothetical protein
MSASNSSTLGKTLFRVATTLTVTIVFLTPAAVMGQTASSGAQRLTIDYLFDRPELTQVNLGDQLYDRLTMPDCPNGGLPGQPALPATGARILLPFGTEVASVRVIAGQKVALGSGYLIEPVSRPVRLSADPATVGPPTPDPVVYGLDRSFPGTRFEEIGTQGFRGYRILTLKLHPVDYVPASGELSYYTNLTVVVETVHANEPAALFRGLAGDQTEVLAKVDNPQAVASYAAEGVRGDRSYDLLILTTPALVSAFQPLKDYHDANGVLTEIRTTDDVGSTNPDDVRDYIRDRYLGDGIKYVIIGADDDIIPAKDLYVETGPGGYVEYSMPADIYFGCLDGTYNYDGDSYWGEPTDGEGGGDVDLVAEVYVGRAAVGDTTEATRFVDKTIWYVNNQHSQTDKVLLVGEYLGFGGPSEYAGDTLDELVDGSDAHGYVTVGIPSDIYTVDKLYERDWPGNDWPQSELVSRINAGIHILDHLGHGSPDYAMKLYDSDIMSQLTNDDLCFVYSQTCLAGHLDGTDCWAEYMNIKTDNGGFAVIMNARYGFGEFNSTDGPSQRFNRELWDAVFSEGLTDLGRANQDSKEDNIYRINEECMRWCTYELNLFGDPTVEVKGVTGMRVGPGSDFLSEGPAGGPFVPSSIVYTVENMGEEGFDYSVTASAPWLTLTNVSGYLGPGEEAEVTVSLNANADALGDGRYEDTITFINETEHIGDTSRDVSLIVGIPDVVYEWTLDEDPGWNTEGQWAFGQPTGGGGAYGGPDPTSGYTGSNVYGYNLSGDYPNYLSETHLTSTAIDCTGLVNVRLKFQRWLGVEQPSYDHAYVRASNDGVNWTTVWENTAEITDASWVEMDVDISAVAEDEPTVYLRWTMGATDGGWTYCGWNIDDIQIIAIGGEEPPLRILLPDGVPECVEPGTLTPVTVRILNGAEFYVPGSGTLHYCYDGGTFLTSALTHVSDDIYQAMLPAAGCADTPEYYFSADGDGGSTVLNPKAAPGDCYTAIVGTLTVIMDDDFETDQGWTAVNLGATSGDWERGVPVNDPSWEYDPASDSDGSGQCYLTQNEMGNTDVDSGAVQLISPTLDMTTDNLIISYDYYLYLTDTAGGVDRLLVEIDGNDGAGPWIEIARHDTNGGLNWRTHVITEADLDAAGVTRTATMRLRFTTNDDAPQSINESGLDAVLISAFVCEDYECDGDFDGDGDVDLGDLATLLSNYGTPSGMQCEDGDMDGDGDVDLTDLAALLALYTG